MDTKKYIIEIPDNTAWIQWIKVSDKDGHVYFDFKDPEDLTPYTEPDLDAVRKEAYDKGYQDAIVKIGSNEQAIAEKAYQRGLNDAWDAARKIAISEADGGVQWKLKEQWFGKFTIYDIFKDVPAMEAIEKIRNYEQKQKEIKVGDEVDSKGCRGIITKIGDDGDHFNVMWENGSTGYYMIGDFKKTGRYFPEIAEVLRKMQGEKNG